MTLERHCALVFLSNNLLRIKYSIFCSSLSAEASEWTAVLSLREVCALLLILGMSE